jgi:hypothetical protein
MGYVTTIAQMRIHCVDFVHVENKKNASTVISGNIYNPKNGAMFKHGEYVALDAARVLCLDDGMMVIEWRNSFIEVLQ